MAISGSYKLAQLKPWLSPFVRAMLQLLSSYGIDGQLYDVYRSPEEQERRFALGDTQAHAGESAHQYGLAFDFVVSSGEQSDLQRAVQSFWKYLGFTTLSWDPAHVEVPDWRRYI